MNSDLSFNRNFASLDIQRRVEDATNDLRGNLQRLSSGIRINSNSEDAAGAAIATRLKSDSYVYAQASRNISNGLSKTAIAKDALEALSDVVMRQQELAEQASSDLYTLEERQTMDDEANALVTEFNRIVSTAEFNGEKIFGSGPVQTTLQAGYGTRSSITFTIGSQSSTSVGTGDLGTRTGYSVGTNPVMIVSGDLNGDGAADLVTVNDVGDNATVLLGNGDGTFQAGSNITVGDGPQGLTLADVNGDDQLDIITANYQESRLGVLLGNGNGTFQAVVKYSTNAPYMVTAADVDGDGNLDLLASNSNVDTISVLKGNGDGTFQAGVTYATGDRPDGIATGDFNEDGVLDVVTADYLGNTASVLIGNPNGSFNAPTAYAVGTAPRSAQVADLNADGHLDIFTSDSNSDTVSVLLGNGDGTFQSRTTVSSVQPYSASAADFDGDGILDLLVSNYGSTGNSALSVHIGNGDGTFGAATSVTTGDRDTWSVAADFNGDSVIDAASTDFNVNSISVFLNSTRKTNLMPSLNLLSAESSAAALEDVLDPLQDRITVELGNIKGAEERLGTAFNNLVSLRENTLVAMHRITDVDTAKETAELVKNQARVDQATAMFAQANLQSHIVLYLLKE